MNLTRRAFLASSTAVVSVAALPAVVHPSRAEPTYEPHLFLEEGPIKLSQSWTPSKREVLEAHDTSLGESWKGWPCYDWGVCDELASEGMLVELEFFPAYRERFYAPQRAWKITEKGARTMDFVRGGRLSLPFRAPNWVLIEATT